VEKGSVFVFASGNGGRNGDQCNFDGYTNSIFSVTVASVDYRGLHPDYSEPCAANMIVAYSSGSGNHITTTDVGKNKCAHTHGGTSAAAPNAAGVFALALSARPDLSWRDIQHICVRTALRINPDDPDWEQTAVGRHYSYKYGYGSLNGYEFVKLAQEWQLVKPQAWVEMPTIQINDGTMDAFRETSGGEFIDDDGVSSIMIVSQEQLDMHNFETLEHITIRVWITHSRRGDVSVELTSPNNVKSILASRRYQDADSSGFAGWTFMTVKHWDENPLGTWTIRVTDQNKEDESGTFLGWTMTLFGSSKDPAKAVKYEVPVTDNVLPPVPPVANPITTITPIPSSTTKSHPKPTAALPGDHGVAEGEASKPAFPEQTPSVTPIPSPSVTSVPTADEGYFSDLANLLSNQFWFFIAIGAVILFGIGAGLFFWRRAVNRRRLNNKDYESLPAGDEVAMSSMGRRAAGGRGPRTKELYDAFGEVSDDEADEHTGLRESEGLEFHSAFLDDDDPSTAAGTARYKDEPEQPVAGPAPSSARTPGPEVGVPLPQSPTGSGVSHDGSWEHASDETRR